jgi:hypothetical protein
MTKDDRKLSFCRFAGSKAAPGLFLEEPGDRWTAGRAWLAGHRHPMQTQFSLETAIEPQMNADGHGLPGT